MQAFAGNLNGFLKRIFNLQLLLDTFKWIVTKLLRNSFLSSANVNCCWINVFTRLNCHLFRVATQLEPAALHVFRKSHVPLKRVCIVGSKGNIARKPSRIYYNYVLFHYKSVCIIIQSASEIVIFIFHKRSLGPTLLNSHDRRRSLCWYCE